MDLWQLHIFCKVVEHKSFSKAAIAVRLSQPTVSSHMKDLEDHFGCRLIDRLTREVLPTNAGQILYDYALKLIALRDEAESALAQFQCDMTGRLTIGGSTIPGGYILPRIVGDFTHAYPGIVISLKIGDTRNIIRDTLSGTLEAAVVGAASDNKNLIQEKLIEDRLCLVVPADHKWAEKKRIGLKPLLKEPFIIRENGSGTRMSIQQSLSEIGRRVEQFNIIAEMGSTEAVIQGIKNNLGISILSHIAVCESIHAGTLRNLSVDGLNLTRSFYLTRHKYRSVTPICRNFTEFLKAHSTVRNNNL